MEYTDVHGVCDVTHTQELFRALEAEMALDPRVPEMELFEGVELLRTLIQNIVVDNKSELRTYIVSGATAEGAKDEQLFSC
jgi:hypothetical protein